MVRAVGERMNAPRSSMLEALLPRAAERNLEALDLTPEECPPGVYNATWPPSRLATARMRRDSRAIEVLTVPIAAVPRQLIEIDLVQDDGGDSERLRPQNPKSLVEGCVRRPAPFDNH
jgi:hypothetical protein